MRKINLTSKRIAAATAISAPRKAPESDDTPNMMLDARYLRQSSSLIQEALQKGFDVLQLATGDIVTTGTKTIVHQYTWDEDKGKLVKYKPEGRKAKRSSDEEEEVSENEDA